MKKLTKIELSVPESFHRLKKFSSLMEDFETYLYAELHRPTGTIISYRTGHNRFIHYLGDVRKLNVAPANVDRQMIVDFITWCKDVKKYKASTYCVYFIAIAQLFRWAYRHGRLSQNVAADIPKPNVPLSLPNPMSPEEIGKMLLQPRTDTFLGIMDKALLEILYGSGLRANELVSLRFRDLHRDPIEDLPYVSVMGKGAKPRLVPLTQPALASIDRYLSIVGDLPLDDLIFPIEVRTLERHILAMAESSGLRDIYPHRFRHSMATHLLVNGAPIEVISELLGHTNLNTTRVYTLITPTHTFSAYRKASFREKIAA